MAKDVRLYLDHVARIGVPTFSGPACLAHVRGRNARGYGDVISNRVVDALGDLAGGVRLQDDPTTNGDVSMKINHGREPDGVAIEPARTRPSPAPSGPTRCCAPTKASRQHRLLHRPARARTGTATSAARSCSSPHGRGCVQVRDGDGAADRPGDVVYFPPGERALARRRARTSYLTHTAISLGTTDWLDEVSAQDYDDSVRPEPAPDGR